MYRLAIEDHDGNRTVVPVARDEVTIGRRVGSTLRLTDRNVSRNHARLRVEPEGLMLYDASRYGTWLNDQKVAAKALVRQGDSLRVGDYRLTMLDEATDSRAPTPIPATGPGAARRPAEVQVARPPGPAAALASASAPASAPASPPAAPAHAPDVEPADAPAARADAAVGEGGGCKVVVTSRPAPGLELALDHSPVTVGRTDENDLILDDESLSRRHAAFRLVDGRWHVHDLESVNGIRVNGLAMDECILSDGDMVELGNVVVRFVDPESAWRFHTAKVFAPVEAPRRRTWPVVAAIGLLVGLVVALLRAMGPTAPADGPAADGVEAAPLPSAADTEAAQEARAPAAEDETTAGRPPRTVEADGWNVAVAARDGAPTVEAAVGPERPLAVTPRPPAPPRAAATPRGPRPARAQPDAAPAPGPAPAAATAPAPRAEPPGAFPEERRAEAEERFRDGQRLFSQGEAEEAEAQLRQAATLNPSLAEPHLILGLIYSRAGRTPDAVRSLKRFLRLAPADKRRMMVEKMLAQMQ